MIIIRILFEILVFVFLSFLIIWKLSFNYRGKVKLNLKTFKSVYQINPEKWKYGSDYWDDSCRHLIYDGRREEMRVKLTFPAFIYFQIGRITSNINRKRKKKNDYLVYFLEDCQKDIDVIKARAENQIKKELEHQKKIFAEWRN